MSETSEADRRAERLAQQLRANLRRRKAGAGKAQAHRPAEDARDADLSKDGEGR